MVVSAEVPISQVSCGARAGTSIMLDAIDTDFAEHFWVCYAIYIFLFMRVALLNYSKFISTFPTFLTGLLCLSQLCGGIFRCCLQGTRHNGYNVLFHSMKNGLTSVKEFCDFLKELYVAFLFFFAEYM